MKKNSRIIFRSSFSKFLVLSWTRQNFSKLLRDAFLRVQLKKIKGLKLKELRD
jgi:hypothetical protein